MHLGDLTIDNAQPLVGTTFTIPLPDGATTTVKLDDVVKFEIRQRRRRTPPRREAFSLFFLGDPALVLAQGMYDLHSETETLKRVFLVPVGRDEAATEYEAVFT
jgi:hypothetical protein